MQQLMQHQDKAVRTDGEKADPVNTTLTLPPVPANGIVQPVGEDVVVEDEEGAGGTHILCTSFKRYVFHLLCSTPAYRNFSLRYKD